MSNTDARRYREEAQRYAREAKQDISDAARTIRDELHGSTHSVRDDVQEAAREVRNDFHRAAYGKQQTSRTQQAQQTAQHQQAQQHAQQTAQQQQAQQRPQNASGPQSTIPHAPAANPRAAERRAWRSRIKNGRLFTGLGAALGIMGLTATFGMISDLSALSVGIVEMIAPLFLFSLMTGGGIAMFAWGRYKARQSKRFHRCLSLIGDLNEVSVETLAKAMPAKEDTVYNILENMINAGVLGEVAYLDYARGVLVLDGSGVKGAPAEPEKQTRTAPETDIGEENSLLREIREVNASIRNQELSRKIDRIEYITERIFEIQREHPEKSDDLKKFLKYYLPTTLKILRRYAELERQGVQGENITATKANIEDAMDKIVEGFETQLDKLFAGDMMDIAADITVMEQMLESDGLTGGGSDFGGMAGGV